MFDFILEELLGGALELILEFAIEPIFRFFKHLIKRDL